MAAIFLPRRWRHQPQGAVDLAPDVSGNSIAYIGGQNRIIRGRDGYSTYGTALTTSTAPAGIAVAGAADSGINLGRLNVAAVGRYTVVFQFRRRTSSRRAIYYLIDSSLGFYQHELIALNSNSTTGNLTGTIQLRLGGTSDRNDYIRVTQAEAVTTLEKIHTCAIRLTGPKTVEIWLDGQQVAYTITASTKGYPNTDDSPLSALSANLLNSSSGGTLGGDSDLFMFARLLQDRPDARELSIDPYGALFRAPSHRIWFDVGAGAPAAIEGDVVAEESGADTLAATGSVVVAGSLAAAETGADTFAATGGAVATGTLAAGEAGADALVGTGKVLVAGGLAAAEAGADNAAATGAVLVAGSLAATETAHDTFSASGAGLVAGTLAAVESGADTITVAGKVVVSGALSAAEVGADTAQATGAVRVSGALSASETGTDTFSSTGEQPRITGEFAASEIGTDGFAAVGIVPAIGSFDLLEAGHDSLTGAGQIIVAGVLGAVESGVDSFYATPAGAIVGVMAAVEAADAFSARGHGRSAHGARMSTDRGYQSMTMGRPAQRATARRPRQRG